MNDREQNDLNLDAPEKLRAALIRSQDYRVVVPRSLDDAILCAAKGHLEAAVPEAQGRQSRAGEHLTWEGWRAAIVAMLHGRRLLLRMAGVASLVAAGVLVWLTVQPGTAVRPEDLNADGQVDMLDAFALARELQQGQAPGPQLDLNGDGVVDESDVKRLATHAVSLGKGGLRNL